MKNVVVKMFAGLLILGLIGCASSGSSGMPKADTTKQFRFDAVHFTFSQLVTPDVAYHTPKELEKLLNDRIKTQLQEKGLLSKQETMNKLNITASYQRRCAGDETSFPSDALGYPHYSYQIEILDGSKVLTSVKKDDMAYSGGMMMNLKVIAGGLTDKKYEVEFVDALADNIVKQITNL